MEPLKCPDCGADFRKLRDDLAVRFEHGLAAAAANQLAQRTPPDQNALIDYFVSLEMQESNRALPVLAFSYLDEQFRLMMLQSMEPMSKSREKDLFGPNGPLGTSSARISLSESIGWLTPDLASSFHRLRQIRNHFGHNSNARLDDDLVKGHLDAHVQADIIKAMLGDRDPNEVYLYQIGRDIQESPMFDIRHRFLVAGYVTAHSALMQVWLLPILRPIGMSPHSLLEDHSDVVPDAVVEWRDGLTVGLKAIMDARFHRLSSVEGGPTIEEYVDMVKDPGAGPSPTDR